MKIAVISAQVFACPPPGYSGLEMIAYHTADGLGKLGHEVVLFAPDGSTCPHARVRPTGPPGGFGEKQAYGDYWGDLMQGGYDAVIDHSWEKWSYILKSEGKLPCPVLGVLHAPVNSMYSRLPSVDKPCIVCISNDQAGHFQALHEREARVCYNGIDLGVYQPIPGMKRSKRFLFLARFSSIKGPDLAIKACRAAGVGLDLVGDTSITGEPAYFEQCRRMCDGEQVRMVGPVTRGETVWWYSQAYALIHPNQRFREPFGLAPVEAQACGCPVVAWDRGAMRETVRDYGYEHYLVRSEAELAAAVCHLRDDPPDQHLRMLVINGAKRFSLENMAGRYEELVKEAIETGGW